MDLEYDLALFPGLTKHLAASYCKEQMLICMILHEVY